MTRNQGPSRTHSQLHNEVTREETPMQSRKAGMRRVLATFAAVTAVGIALTGCAGEAAPQESGSASDLDTVLEEGGKLTYWTWQNSAQAQADAFEKLYPNVEIEVVNAGTNVDEYTAIQNAITAGSGAPDIAQVEYYAVPQFALNGDLVDLNQFGFGDLEDSYTPGPWSGVNFGDGLWGLPQDSGPMVMLYNKSLFDKHGIAVPTTWDEYVEAAQQLQTADPNAYLVADNGDSGFTTSMIWQAGGRPFQVDGTNVSIDLQDKGSKLWADTWNQLIENQLAAPISPWSDEWYRAIGQDQIGTLLMGAWMPGILETSVPESAGDWRVAPLPTYDGTPVSSENGGSAEVVLSQSKNQALAAAFLKWANHSEEGVGIFLESGGFPSTTANLQSEEFLSAAPEYFGGQEINKVMVDAASSVSTGWQYLPYQVYALSIFGDTVGQSYESGSNLNTGLVAWQDQLRDYGSKQGFTVK